MIKSIYFDMDGVLTNFDKYMEGILGYAIVHAKDNVIKDTLTENIQNGFFANLEPMSDFFVAKQLMNHLKSIGYEVLILTAIGDTQFNSLVQKHKQEWLKKHGLSVYPSIFVNKSHQKAIYANDSSILIDDRNKSIKPFVKRGGVGIKHTSMLNTLDELHIKRCLCTDFHDFFKRQLLVLEANRK